jgi:hypothetical protein
MEAPPGGSPASPAEAEAVILGTQKGMTAPPTLSLLMTTGSATLSHFQQTTTGLPAQGLASTISNFCCGSYRLPRVPEGGLPAEVRVRHP